jgi:hypothetical protein
VGCRREQDDGGGLGLEEKDNGDGTQINQQQLKRKAHKFNKVNY